MTVISVSRAVYHNSHGSYGLHQEGINIAAYVNFSEHHASWGCNLLLCYAKSVDPVARVFDF